MSHSNIRWSTPLVLFVTTPAMGIAVGAATNLINVLISPDYFRVVMNVMWYLGPLGVRGFAVRQGIIEGGALGSAVGFLMSVSIAASTRLRCPLSLALKYLALVMTIVVGCWIIGGAAGMLLMWQIPTLWGTFFLNVPVGANPFGIAWAGGTIWGSYAGSVISLAVATVLLHLRWKKLLSSASEGFPILKSVGTAQDNDSESDLNAPRRRGR